MFHIPAHKNLTAPAGQTRTAPPTEFVWVDVCAPAKEGEPRTCFARILQQRILDRAEPEVADRMATTALINFSTERAIEASRKGRN